MIKVKHIEDIRVELKAGNYPSLYDDSLPFDEKIADIQFLGNRQTTIATALLFGQSPKMFEVLRQLLEWEKEAWENDDDINGGDAVDFIAQMRVEAHEALAPYINHPILDQPDGLAHEDQVEGG